jgi:hypothetical protein
VIDLDHTAYQLFTTPADHDTQLLSIKLLLARLGTPGYADVNIYNVVAGEPSGAGLCYATLNCDSLPTGAPYEWVTFTMTTVATLLANTQYAIVLTCPCAVLVNALYWRHDGSSPSYSGGNASVCTLNAEALFEYLNTGYNTSIYFSGNDWAAQTFTPAVTHYASKCKILLYRIDNPGTVTVSIKAVDGSNHPTGADLCSGTTNGNTLDGTWREITFTTSALLTAGTMYAIVVRCSGSIPNYVQWYQDSTSPPYTGGNSEISADAGASWTAQTRDCMFEEWGYAYTLSTTADAMFEAWGVVLIWKISVDWDDDGVEDTIDDITAYVKEWSTERGRDTQLSDTVVGTAEIIVSNIDKRFTPKNSGSPLYGYLKSGKKVTITAQLPGVSCPRYAGYIDYIDPKPNRTEKEAYIYCVDKFDRFVGTKRNTSMMVDAQDVEILAAIVASVQKSGETIETAFPSYRDAYPYFWMEDEDAYDKLMHIARSSLGFIYIDTYDRIVYERRGDRSLVSSVHTFTNKQYRLGYTFGRRELINSAKTTAHPRSEGTPATELWYLEDTPEIAAGDTLHILAKLSSPATVIDTPVATTDYTANSQADGLGDDETANVTITLTKYGESCDIAIHNATWPAHTVYITFFSLSGTPLEDDSQVSYLKEDSTSITDQGVRSDSFDATYIDKYSWAKNRSEYLVALKKDPLPELIYTLRPADYTLLYWMCVCNLSSCVHIEEDETYTDDDFFIEKVRDHWRADFMLETEWVLSSKPASWPTPYPTDDADVLYEFYIEPYDNFDYIQDLGSESSRSAQSFTPSANHTITKVRLLLLRQGSPGTISVGIKATDINGLPTGADLCNGTTNGDTLPDVSPCEWREVTLGAGVSLSAGVQYAIVVRVSAGDNSNYVEWLCDYMHSAYSGGCALHSLDLGITWDEIRDEYWYHADFMFEELGTP